MKTIVALSASLALAVAMGASTAASAKNCADHQRHTANRDALYGAVAGGLLGNAVSHGGGKTGGTLIGAGAGGLIGHQIGKNRASCDHAYSNSRNYHRDSRGRRYYVDRYGHRHFI